MENAGRDGKSDSDSRDSHQATSNQSGKELINHSSSSAGISCLTHSTDRTFWRYRAHFPAFLQFIVDWQATCRPLRRDSSTEACTFANTAWKPRKGVTLGVEDKEGHADPSALARTLDLLEDICKVRLPLKLQLGCTSHTTGASH